MLSSRFRPAVFLIVFLCVLHEFPSAFGDETVLCISGRTKHQIVIPDTCPNRAAEYSVSAAAELIRKVFAASGAELETVRESERNPGKYGIFLGPTRFAASHGVESIRLKKGELRHKSVGKNIIIAGCDLPDPVAKRFSAWDLFDRNPLPPRDIHGTLRSAAEFLYRHAGARFLSPEPDGMEIIPNSMIAVPEKLDCSEEVFFLAHNTMGIYPGSLFSTANNCNTSQDVWFGGGHSHWKAVIKEVYWKSHPEYFTLLNGIRSAPGRRGHLCFSNPQVRELIYRHILRECDAGYEIVEVGQNDGFIPCECGGCRTLFGITPSTMPSDGIRWMYDRAWGRKIWILHRELAERLMKDRPGRKMLISAYGPTVDPPPDFSDFPPNVMVQLTQTDEKQIAQWRKKNVPGGFGAYLYLWGSYHFSGYTPRRTYWQTAEVVERLVRNGIRHVFVDMPPSEISALEGPNRYVYLRLGMFPSLKKPNELFNEYMDAAFSESSEQMRRFFITLQNSVALWEGAADYLRKYGRDMPRAFAMVYTPEVMNTLEKLLSAAESKAVSSRVVSRLKRVRREFNFLKEIVNVSYAWHQFKRTGNHADYAALLDAVETRNRNLPSPRLKNNGLYLGVPPFNWNVGLMRARGPEKPPLPAEALPVSEIPGLDFPAWKNVKAQSLAADREGSGTNPRSSTTFKVVYTKEHLVIRVSGVSKDPLKKYEKRGRDAEIHKAESVTIQISPSGDDGKWFYFSYDCVPGSFADAEHGFITDPFDPRFGWNDWNWNGKWRFETRIDGGVRWESMAVIPFATLRTGMPKPGDTWRFNIARIHFPSSGGSELSAWTGKVNKSYLPGSGSFGDLIFR